MRRLVRSDSVAFDAGDLNQPTDWVTCQSEIVFHGDLCSIFYLGQCSFLEEIKDAGVYRTQARKRKEIFASKKSRPAM